MPLGPLVFGSHNFPGSPLHSVLGKPLCPGLRPPPSGLSPAIAASVSLSQSFSVPI